MQKLIFIRNLGENLENQQFENGEKVTQLSVGVTEGGYTTESGIDIPQHTEWFDCVAKNQLADVVEKYLEKGHKVSVEVKKRTRTFTGSDNKEHWTVEFVVEKERIK